MTKETLSTRDKEVLKIAQEVLRKHMVGFVFSNDYPVRATPHAIIESLVELVAMQLSEKELATKEIEIEVWNAEICYRDQYHRKIYIDLPHDAIRPRIVYEVKE